ncbi:MAG: hypothetical protein NVSMB32_18010 [Actinomycetota bacterium]
MPLEPATDPARTDPAEKGWATGIARVLLRNKSLLERLGELRNRIFKALAALVVASTLAWLFYSPILSLLVHPLQSLPGAPGIVDKGRLVFTAPPEAFYVRIRVTVFAGTAVASPFILWQAWRFFAGGLRR